MDKKKKSTNDNIKLKPVIGKSENSLKLIFFGY
jgi:hypothetical protein